MDNQVIKRLKKARETISTPATWIQENMARDAKGRVVDATSGSAKSFCLAGAYLKYSEGTDEKDRVTGRCRRALQETLTTRGYTGLKAASVVVFNDTSTHEEVLAFIDETIERLEGVDNEE